MQKVLLTKDQADQVEEIISERSVWHQLKDLSREELGAVISGHYDMVPELPKLQPGDLVVLKDGNPIYEKERIGTIARKVKFSYESITVEGSDMIRHIHRSKIRHATIEEIFWYKNLRRNNIGDFREFDVLKVQGMFYQVFKHMGCEQYGSHISPEYAQRIYEDGAFHSLMPAESFMIFPKEKEKCTS